jgi:hypothetical protein
VAARPGLAYVLAMQTRDVVVALALALALGFGCSHGAAPGAPPATTSTPSAELAVGAKVPDGQLTRATGDKIALADVVNAHARTVVVFYRGFW